MWKEGRKEGYARSRGRHIWACSQQLFPSAHSKPRACYAKLEACSARCRILAHTWPTPSRLKRPHPLQHTRPDLTPFDPVEPPGSLSILHVTYEEQLGLTRLNSTWLDLTWLNLTWLDIARPFTRCRVCCPAITFPRFLYRLVITRNSVVPGMNEAEVKCNKGRSEHSRDNTLLPPRKRRKGN